MTTNAAAMLSVDGPIARRIDGYDARPQQIAMAEAVEHALATRGRLLVEAGTGVGKSFAYLLPAIHRATEHGERVVISTHTINLQEQLIDKDLPLLNSVTPDEFSAVLVKGRANYVSLRRLKLASERQDRLFSDDDARHRLHVVEDWAYDTTDGTLATLPEAPRADVWDHVQSDAHNCMGRKCPYHQQCFFQRARRRMENANILVCNHALFFSDLALRAGGVGFLPPYDHVIFDEAHGLEEVAAEHFGVSLSETRVTHLLRVLYDLRRRRGFLDSLQLDDGEMKPIDDAIRLVLETAATAERFFDDVEAWQERYGASNGRVRDAHVVENTLTPALGRLGGHLRLLRERARKEADQFELNAYAVRADDIARSAEALITQTIDGGVYSIEGVGANDHARRSRRRRRIVLRCMTVDVAPVLREHLFAKDASVVMTSATLATGPDDFRHIQRRLGCEEATTRQLGSPFAFARQMRVFVDPQLPEPNHPRAVDAIVPRIRELIARTDGGAFILFTSFRQLDRVADQLRDELLQAGHPVFVHGADGPPGLLLRRFRDDRRSVLFGTTSFWQGVDVRGDGLRLVVITRLPFDVPDRPLIEARHERIRERGGSPFGEDQIPRAVIRFRQGVGRLIRSADDEGIVAVLDPRIVTKPYGRQFQAALPEGVEIEPMEPLAGDPSDDFVDEMSDW